jgi:hypothetical protein
MAIGNAIGIPFKLGSSYWTPQRKPTYIALEILSDTSIKVYWQDPIDNTPDGIKIYANDVLKETVAFGVETKDITGLTANTEYTVKVVAYKGTHESAAISDIARTFEKWFLAGGISADNAKVAYYPKGKATLAESYINEVNPGTNDQVAVVAPTLDADGWNFNGSQYLRNGLVPVNNQTWSSIVRFSNWVAANSASIFGIYESADKQFRLSIDNASNAIYGGNGGQSVGIVPKLTQGVLAFAGANIFINSVVNGATIPVGSGSFTYDEYTGQVHYSSNSGWFTGKIQSRATYNAVLTAAQIYKLTVEVEDYAVQKKNYVARKFGALICWGLPSFFNYTASEKAPANGNPDLFNPTGIDMDEWLDTLVASGMKYAILTVKHHDGFCLWPSTYSAGLYTPYSIAQSAWYTANGNRDITAEFCTKCRERNLKVGLYFSILDETWEARTSKDETTDAAAYIAMIQGQLNELLSNYGNIDSLWFDGWQWHTGYANIPYSTIYNYIKGKQANCVVVDNNRATVALSSPTEILVYEKNGTGDIPEANYKLAEETQTIRSDVHWYWHPDDAQTVAKYYTKAEVNNLKSLINTRGGAFLLGVSPDTSGHLPAVQKELLESLTT